MMDDVEREELLADLAGWEAAYPLPMFPEPDFKEADRVLKQHGISLSAISASNMRHVVNCIVPKVRTYLQENPDNA